MTSRKNRPSTEAQANASIKIARTRSEAITLIAADLAQEMALNARPRWAPGALASESDAWGNAESLQQLLALLTAYEGYLSDLEEHLESGRLSVQTRAAVEAYLAARKAYNALMEEAR